MTARTLAARDRLPPGTVHDVDYDALVHTPFEVVRGIYARFGLPFTDDYVERLRAAIAERPQHAHGVHAYDLADFELDAAALAPRFAVYRERFLTA